jgi:hypothetical protein
MTTLPRTSSFIRAVASISALLLVLFGHPMDVAHAELPAPPDGEAWIVMRDKSDESMNYVLLNLKKAGRRQRLTCGGGLQDQSVTCGAQPYYWFYTLPGDAGLRVELNFHHPGGAERLAKVLDEFARAVTGSPRVRAVVRCAYPITYPRSGAVCSGQRLPRKTEKLSGTALERRQYR